MLVEEFNWPENIVWNSDGYIGLPMFQAPLCDVM
jgi:hypothetical protein